jgi:hypothetical protein
VRNLVVTVEDEFALLRIVAIAGDGAVQNILLMVNLEADAMSLAVCWVRWYGEEKMTSNS